MVRTRRVTRADPPQPDLATIVAELRRQMTQQQELARQDQRPQAQEALQQAQYVPSVVPKVLNVPVQPEIRPEVRQEVPVAPARMEVNPLPVREDLLYEHFRSMKAHDFEGLT